MQHFENNPDSLVKQITMFYQRKVGHLKQPSIKHREITVKSLFGKKINETNLYYDNGQLYKHCFYFDDKLDGLFNSFYKDGKQWEEMVYDKGNLVAVNYIKSPYGDLMKNDFTNGTGTVNFYNCDGALESKIDYKDGIKHGDAIYYYYGSRTNNPKRAEGQYVKGKKIGEWKYYEEHNFNKLDRTVTYNEDWTAKSVQELGGRNKKYADLLFGEYHGTVKHFNAYKELLNEYTYRHGVLHGPYINNNGALTEKGEYSFGTKTGEIGYYRGDKLRETENKINNITVDSSFFEPDTIQRIPHKRTSKYKHDSHYLKASFFGGLANESVHMAVYLNDPDSAVANKVKGAVKVEITIDGFGEATTKLVRGIGYGCDEEALRVINLMPLFEPALFRGFPVESKLIRTIYFPVPIEKKNMYHTLYRYIYQLNSRQWINNLVYN